MSSNELAAARMKKEKVVSLITGGTKNKMHYTIQILTGMVMKYHVSVDC